MTPAQHQAILVEVRGGNKIAAIKLCREATGMGLAEAKEWVEKLEASPEAVPPAVEVAGALAPIAELLFKGEKISAIKLYREQVEPGSGLKEAKEAVEKLEAGLRAQHPEKFTAKAKSGCAAVLAILAMLVIALVSYRLLT
ncbi:MAG: hypothetical protein B9S33_16695 [Pedosphaera sp. Tous-C6FEB]|nr:MAG: hypothetical protein B9S33_16695 [Pedosphaera sp. Tous-C6FEB]